VTDEKKTPNQSGPSDAPMRAKEMDALYRRLQPELRRPKPSPEALTAALEAAQKLATEADTENAVAASTQRKENATTTPCVICGYQNRVGNKFCGACGAKIGEAEQATANEALAIPPRAPLAPVYDGPPEERRGGPNDVHYYHHHYHHHYFPGGQEGAYSPRGAADAAREDKMRPTAALRGDMSRAEAAVRRITHEWVLACNTKHLDDLLDLYVPDALVLRSNCAPVRGAVAVREFFYGALDAGLGEVEIEPLRVEVVGDLAYEAGRCKALIPSATGKRREERGKYLWVCARQNNGEWKLAADCWASDLTLSPLESDVPASAGVRTNQPRKG
jgi:uncharacterized protein (TIGR02246 family)